MKSRPYDRLEEIDIYFKDIEQYESLSRTEEVYLAKEIRKGNQQALDKLVQANLKFVVNVAKAYRNSGVPFSDLISEGNMGLIHAATKYDYTRDTKFITYAVWWIRDSILKCIETYRNNEFNGDCYLFERHVDDDDDDGYVDSSPRCDFEDELINADSRNTSLDELMQGLKDREIQILSMYFGLNGGKEMNLDEIGQKMNLTMERVRQIKQKAIDKMKVNALMSDEFETYSQII